ncbi:MULTISPECIES: ubiquinone biosynthesis accessory factor UbiK [Methylophaga]|jgi:BMFP domain-containing protein YqiC|uniref:Ubiquinone biosynthesis accessory factor UbiK n=1 Tax=Methylophaga muralis TaxID=291169 RepID=A0A1E3GP73_9GAMM|nr:MULTISPECIES: accessory factor UbiK family protein [Methylophaga]MDO8826118.1 accessory factor UbiK family protein [Methylophaga sp.]ODN65735.1 Membrane fusogenic activity [Methylophaga muralis]
MIDPKKFDEIADTITRALPPGLLQMRDDAEKNIRAAMTSTFNKLDLVTREEFEVQSQVLLRTREKLEALEKRVEELEQLNNK